MLRLSLVFVSGGKVGIFVLGLTEKYPISLLLELLAQLLPVVELLKEVVVVNDFAEPGQYKSHIPKYYCK